MHAPHPAPARPRAVAAAAVAALCAALLGGVGAAPAQAAAAPVHAVVSGGGPVTGTSCSGTGCTLYAKAGTTSVGSSGPLDVWNFVAADGTVTGASSVLVATSGVAQKITVHNSLAYPVTLSIPGLTGFATDYTGVAPGAEKTYTFTPTRAGTFVYQAGHVTGGTTDPGPREVAMGLAGALVVRPAGAANRALDVTVPASDFDDEAVLVLTELDPVFAKHPMTTDLRTFAPAYRLVNGTAWPATTQIGTAPGHRVLLRYVNAGVGSASMGVLGGVKQSVVADNAYPADGGALVADTLAAGDTEDVVVTIPAAGGNFPVVDTTGRLDSNGVVDGSANKQLAFGGRMTMLSTTGGLGGAVDPGGDTVGPATSGLSLAPNPAPVNTDVALAASFTDPTVTAAGGTYGPSAVTAAEYTFDQTVAPGAGTAMTVTAGGTTGLATGSATIPAAALAGKSGLVKVYVRAQDAAGNWGPTASVTLSIPNGGPKVTGLAASPALTNGAVAVRVTATGDDSLIGSTIRSMAVTVGPDDYPMTFAAGSVVAGSVTLPATVVDALADGPNDLTVTATDALGLTGTGTVRVTIDKVAPTGSGAALEPATANNGTLGSAVDPTSVKVSATFEDVSSKVVAAEGFFNTAAEPAASAFGTGFVFVAADGAFDSTSESAYGLVPLSELTALPDGPVTIRMHARDAAGNWGTQFTTVQLQVDRTAPVVGGLTATQAGGAAGTVNLAFSATGGSTTSPVVAAEYFLGTTDPGAGSGTALTVSPALPRTGSPVSLAGTATGVPVGGQRVNVRVRDAAGNWSAVAAVTLTVYPEPLFSDTFPSNSSANWGARTGGSAAPTYPTVASSLGMNGARAMLTANGSGASNVTTPTLNPAVTPYYARFLFRPNTLSTAGQVNVLTLRSGTTATRGAVQYRVNGGNRQVRAVNNTTTGAWYTLPNGQNATYTVQVSWTGGTAGSTVVRVNGVVASSVTTGGGANQTVNNAVMGTSAASGTVTGQAYFDWFTASRIALPN